MNRRLQQFLELEQLKPAQFADIMGIQRSNVSHILSGRNKPGFDFIQKFLLKFPSVNPDWLLLGRGKPLREQNAPPSQTRDSSPAPGLFTPVIELEQNGESTAFESTAQSENDAQNIMDDGSDENACRLQKVPARDVRRITLFYSDGTFQEFYPPK